MASHNLLDVGYRLIYGFFNVCIVLPIGAEKLPVLFLLSVAGVWTALKKGPREFRFLLLFFFIQLLPFIWTNMPNPNTRVPYGSTFPFEPFFAACFLALFAAKLDAHSAGGSDSAREVSKVKLVVGVFRHALQTSDDRRPPGYASESSSFCLLIKKTAKAGAFADALRICECPDLGNPAKQAYHDPLDREFHSREKICVGRIFRFKEWLPVIEKIAL